MRFSILLIVLTTILATTTCSSIASSSQLVSIEARRHINNPLLDVHLKRQLNHPHIVHQDQHRHRLQRRSVDDLQENSDTDGEQEECGSYTLALDIDTSASIFMPLFGGSEENIDLVKTALKECIATLEGEPVSVALYSFASAAKQETNGYIDMQKPTAIALLNSAIGDGQNWGGSGNGIRFSENQQDLLTNWEDALLKVRETSRPPAHRPDFLVFVTDGDPTTRNDANDDSQTNIGAALDELVRMHDSNDSSVKTKVIPLGIGSGASEENLRALTGLVSPQLGQDYFLASDFSALKEILQTATLSETCCKRHRDECGVCHGDGASCKNPRFRTWTSLFTDENLENHYDYNYGNNWLVDKQRLYVQTRLDLLGRHHHYDHALYRVEVSRVSVCASRDGEMQPFVQTYAYRTGCRSTDVSVDICTLYDKERPGNQGHEHSTKIAPCYNTKNETSWHHQQELDLDEIFGFDWLDEHRRDAFTFKARALSKHRQLLQVHWKLVYKHDHGSNDAHEHYLNTYQFMEEIEIESDGDEHDALVDTPTSTNPTTTTTTLSNGGGKGKGKGKGTGDDEDDDDDNGGEDNNQHGDKGRHYGRHCSPFNVKCPEKWQHLSLETWECVRRDGNHHYGDDDDDDNDSGTMRFVFVCILVVLFLVLACCIYAVAMFSHRDAKCVYKYHKSVVRGGNVCECGGYPQPHHREHCPHSKRTTRRRRDRSCDTSASSASSDQVGKESNSSPAYTANSLQRTNVEPSAHTTGNNRLVAKTTTFSVYVDTANDANQYGYTGRNESSIGQERTRNDTSGSILRFLPPLNSSDSESENVKEE